MTLVVLVGVVVVGCKIAWRVWCRKGPCRYLRLSWDWLLAEEGQAPGFQLRLVGAWV